MFGKSNFLYDASYIAAIENCCVHMVVKHTLFATHVASLLIGASFTIFSIYAHNVIVNRHLVQHKVVATELYT